MKFKKKKLFIIITIILIVVLLVGVLGYAVLYSRNKEISKSNLTDGWVYKPNSEKPSKVGILSGVLSSTATAGSKYSVAEDSATSASNSYLGYEVGGASNIENFRKNIKNGYLPISTDITYNGIYSEYYFDTGSRNVNESDMFYPSYSCAVSTNPFSKEQEYYMSVGLNSNIKESDFNRKNVNLVIVLDISGSMSSSFNSYYYDQSRSDNIDKNKSKMKIAEECVNNLIDKLRPEDRLGIVLFDDDAYLGKELSKINETNIDSLKSHILEVEPRGGTNFSEGYTKGTNLFSNYLSDNSYQNRIVVITDAMPNMGDVSENGLSKKINDNADKKIYTSMIGVGVDFNTKLTEKLSDVKGANYYSVHNAEEFNEILAEKFDYMITPLIYDLDLNFKSEDFKIENVYGSDSVNKSTGNIMHINTLFPSARNFSGDVKGGIVVLKLKRVKEAENPDISLNISYKDNEETEHSNSQKVEFKMNTADYYNNTGIRKAIVLARYTNVMKDWILFERSQKVEFAINEKNEVPEPIYDEDYIKNVLGIHERQSQKLTVCESYKNIFKELKTYIQSEKNILNDENLNKEVEIIEKLI